MSHSASSGPATPRQPGPHPSSRAGNDPDPGIDPPALLHPSGPWPHRAEIEKIPLSRLMEAEAAASRIEPFLSPAGPELAVIEPRLGPPAPAASSEPNPAIIPLSPAILPFLELPPAVDTLGANVDPPEAQTAMNRAVSTNRAGPVNQANQQFDPPSTTGQGGDPHRADRLGRDLIAANHHPSESDALAEGLPLLLLDHRRLNLQGPLDPAAEAIAQAVAPIPFPGPWPAPEPTGDSRLAPRRPVPESEQPILPGFPWAPGEIPGWGGGSDRFSSLWGAQPEDFPLADAGPLSSGMGWSDPRELTEANRPRELFDDRSALPPGHERPATAGLPDLEPLARRGTTAEGLGLPLEGEAPAIVARLLQAVERIEEAAGRLSQQTLSPLTAPSRRFRGRTDD